MVAVRLAEEKDAPGIARVHVAGWKKAYAAFVPDEILARLDLAARVDEWKRRLLDGEGSALVAVLDEEALGFSYFGKSRDDDAAENVGEVLAIYVHPSRWRSGIGRALLDDSLSRLKALGFEKVTLWVFSENVAARRFYSAMGFHEDGATKEHPETGLLELRYERSLSVESV